VKLIEDYESKHFNGTTTPIKPNTPSKYGTIVKLRTDGLWFGPMMPACAFSKNKVYISRQKDRKSDKFFVLPRTVAETFLDSIHNSTGIFCQGQATKPVEPDPLLKHYHIYKYPFEDVLFEVLEKHATKQNVTVKATLFPRVISRSKCAKGKKYTNGKYSPKDRDDKCRRFLWSVPLSDCGAAMYGE
jgi:hypothetical protein